MLDNETRILRTACGDRFGVPVPDQVAAAEALHTAAVELTAKVRSETPPDLSALTVKTLDATVAAMVAWDNRDDRLAAAAKIEKFSAGRVLDAWDHATSALMEAFRRPFDAAAATFVEALAELGGDLDTAKALTTEKADAYNTLMAAAADLHVLAEVRAILGTRYPSSESEHNVHLFGQVATLPSYDVFVRKFPSTQAWAPEWWAAVSAVPGVEIKWHTPTEQQSYLDIAVRTSGASKW